MIILDLPNELNLEILNNIQHNDKMYNNPQSIDAFYIISKIKLVSKQYNKIAETNINERQLHPKAKFKKGCIVKYNQKWKDKSIKRCNELRKLYGNIGELPHGRLIIYAEPLWNYTNNCYSYYYEYGWGGTHEGHALETDLDPLYELFIIKNDKK